MDLGSSAEWTDRSVLLGEALPEQAVGVLVRAALLGKVRPRSR
jgi:hypothetical protein